MGYALRSGKVMLTYASVTPVIKPARNGSSIITTTAGIPAPEKKEYVYRMADVDITTFFIKSDANTIPRIDGFADNLNISGILLDFPSRIK